MVDLVRYLHERDIQDGWTAEIERNVPESLRGMIERKLESLDDEERQLLRVAAVQGVQFDSAIVAQVLERDPADVEDSLQSLDQVHGLVQLLREQELPSRLFSLRYQFVHALYQSVVFHAWMHGYREDWETCLRSASEGISFSGAHRLVQTSAWHHCVHGWALARTGRTADGLVQLQNGIEDSLRIMGHVAMPQFVGMLAEVLMIRGEHARALDEIQRILMLNESKRDLYFNAELHRLTAECHLALDEPEAAKTALGRAIETARSQGP